MSAFGTKDKELRLRRAAAWSNTVEGGPYRFVAKHVTGNVFGAWEIWDRKEKRFLSDKEAKRLGPEDFRGHVTLH